MMIDQLLAEAWELTDFNNINLMTFQEQMSLFYQAWDYDNKHDYQRNIHIK